MNSGEAILDLNINFNVPKKEQDESYQPKTLAISYINYATRQKYPEGLEGQRRRILGRLQRKLDVIAESETETVLNLDAAEVDFLKTVFAESTKFPIQAAKYVMLLEDAVNKL